MKRIFLMLFFLIFSPAPTQADPQYILIKQRWIFGMKLIHVEKPKKNLHKWYYDKKNDTYYRMKGAW
ncbi:MAG: hypothetical protein K9G49_16055, partial [Taibaiella sp.]|nr:hypothetical protein [Taibaiella sp.]